MIQGIKKLFFWIISSTDCIMNHTTISAASWMTGEEEEENQSLVVIAVIQQYKILDVPTIVGILLQGKPSKVF